MKNRWSKGWWTGITGMPELESEQSAAQRRNQSARGLKILTPDQMVSRLPIMLAH